MTFSITTLIMMGFIATLRIMTLSIMTFNTMIHSIMGLIATLSITASSIRI
jgi:hypothetical protein